MRAQIKMFETVGVLVVFFFLLVTAGAFYFGVQQKSIDEERMHSAEMLGLQTALRVLYLPELDCSFLGTRKSNCIDKLKLKEFRSMLSDEDVVQDYFEGFGFSTISVRQAWPCSLNETLCQGFVLYDNQVNYSYAATTLSPILLLDPWREEHSFGVVEVRVYVP